MQDRIYFDENNVKLWEMQLRQSDPGCKLPKKWTIDDMMYDPTAIPLKDWSDD